jgi:hypothetical protein
MVDREEHLKISDLLYAKAKEMNLQEDIVSRMLSSECLLVSFDHMVDAFLYDWNYMLYNSNAGRDTRHEEFQSYLIFKCVEEDVVDEIIKLMEEIYELRNKLLYLRKANINIIIAKAKPEIDSLLEWSNNARDFIKNKLFR